VRKEVLRYGPLVLRVDVALLKVGNAGPIRLEPAQAKVMAELMRHHDRVCTRDHLLTIGDQWEIGSQVIDVWVCQLRPIIAGSGAHIATIHGEGYMLTIRDVEPFRRRPYANQKQLSRAVKLVISGATLSEAARCLDLARTTVRIAATRAGVWPRHP